ncbi:MAG: GSCFA family protein [Betaproteobacteria bacterium ADurb.Bin341]|nr:MAG: GSCFA family protein [Betaproteobacteria bacterium ADurb.Bin341]
MNMFNTIARFLGFMSKRQDGESTAVIEESRRLVESGNVDLGRALLVEQSHTNPRDAALQRELGILLLHHSGGRVSEIVLAEKAFRAATIIAPEDAELHYWLGESFCYQGRVAEAEAIFERSVVLLEKCGGSANSERKARIYERYGQALQANDKTDRAMEFFQRAIDIEPKIAEATHDLAGASYNLRGLTKLKGRPSSTKIARWPMKLDQVSDLRKAVFQQFVDCAVSTPLLSARSRVLTLGSCFAQNVAMVLTRRGAQAKSLSMGELINSTFANRALLHWLLDEAEGELDEETLGVFTHYYGAEKSTARDHFVHADVFIFTLGVAPCFFNKKSGAFHLSYPNTNTLHLLAENEFRTTSVAENVQNIEDIVDSVRKLSPGATIFFTVSPVPLAATFEYSSAILADCVSKSTLRVAIDEVCRSNRKGIYYWPSFEIVRWLGIYEGGAYGAEDGTSRHVSEHYIDVIMEAFIAHYGSGDLK